MGPPRSPQAPPWRGRLRRPLQGAPAGTSGAPFKLGLPYASRLHPLWRAPAPARKNKPNYLHPIHDLVTPQIYPLILRFRSGDCGGVPGTIIASRLITNRTVPFRLIHNTYSLDPIISVTANNHSPSSGSRRIGMIFLRAIVARQMLRDLDRACVSHAREPTTRDQCSMIRQEHTQ